MHNASNKLFSFFFAYHPFEPRRHGVNEAMKNYITMYLNIEKMYEALLGDWPNLALVNCVTFIVKSTLCKKCHSQGQEGKPIFFFFKQSSIFGVLRWNHLKLIHSFNTCVVPSWGNQNTERRQIFNVKWQRNKPLNYKSYCKKSIGFPPTMAAKRHNFCLVWICIR